MISERTALEIHSQDGTACHAPEVSQEPGYRVIGKMVQEERADHIIEASGPERQEECVGADFGRPGSKQVRMAQIERADTRAGEPLLYCDARFTGSRANVEHGEFVRRPNERSERRAQDAVTAEITVDAGQIAEAVAGIGGAGVIEKLRLDDAAGIDERFQAVPIIRRAPRLRNARIGEENRNAGLTRSF